MSDSIQSTSAIAQERRALSPYPPVIQGSALFARTIAAMSTAEAVHLDAAKERAYKSSSASDSAASRKPMRQLHTSAAAAADSNSANSNRKQQPTPAAHKGGPKAIVAAKQHWPSQYQEVGRITGQYSIPRKQVFAVVELGATQFKVLHSALLMSTCNHAVAYCKMHGYKGHAPAEVQTHVLQNGNGVVNPNWPPTSGGKMDLHLNICRSRQAICW